MTDPNAGWTGTTPGEQTIPLVPEAGYAQPDLQPLPEETLVDPVISLDPWASGPGLGQSSARTQPLPSLPAEPTRPLPTMPAAAADGSPTARRDAGPAGGYGSPADYPRTPAADYPRTAPATSWTPPPAAAPQTAVPPSPGSGPYAATPYSATPYAATPYAATPMTTPAPQPQPAPLPRPTAYPRPHTGTYTQPPYAAYPEPSGPAETIDQLPTYAASGYQGQSWQPAIVDPVAYDYGYRGTPTSPHPNAAISMVLGILGIVAFGPLAPIAWFLAAKGRREMAYDPARWSRSGMLTAGYVLGIIGTILLGLGILFIFFVIAMMASFGR